MALYVTVATLKAHLRIDDTAEDTLLQQYILAAQDAAECYMHRPIVSTTDDTAVCTDAADIPPGIIQYILVTAGDYYKQRENRGEKTYTLYFTHLLDPWVRYAYGDTEDTSDE